MSITLLGLSIILLSGLLIWLLVTAIFCYVDHKKLTNQRRFEKESTILEPLVLEPVIIDLSQPSPQPSPQPSLPSYEQVMRDT